MSPSSCWGLSSFEIWNTLNLDSSTELDSALSIPKKKVAYFFDLANRSGDVSVHDVAEEDVTEENGEHLLHENSQKEVA